jgi:hypothetical protein
MVFIAVYRIFIRPIQKTPAPYRGEGCFAVPLHRCPARLSAGGLASLGEPAGVLFIVIGLICNYSMIQEEKQF